MEPAWGGTSAQDNFVAAPKNFDLIHVKTKLLGQPNRLAIAGLKNTSQCHNRFSIVCYSGYLQ